MGDTERTATTFTFRAAFDALLVPGVTERWNAVQEQLHPHLLRLAEQVQAAASQRYPRQWPLYEVSFKSQRYINRGHGERAPIDEYHVAFDRPPRGAGILVSVSSAERAVLVGVQLWGIRKQALRQVWATSRPAVLPLVARIGHEGQARFARKDPAAGDTHPADTPSWLDTYLDTRSASYLWAGFVHPWDALPDNLDNLEAQICDDVLALFPLNEAVMEQAEAREPEGAALLRERRAVFAIHAATPTIETIVERIQARGFAFSETTIRAYHIALQTRPLVLLTGISGTGKTRLTQLYADAVHGTGAATRDNPCYLRVSVQPDWHNARDILGYYNALTERYHPTPLLRFLLQAAADPHQPYFVCLDEMNLARPEYYLAPILSAIETTERTIDLAAPAEQVQTTTGEWLPNPFRLPLNIAITGTVNVDESTHMLSDKLLDRANVIELTEIDLEAFRQTYEGEIASEAWHIITQIHAIMREGGQPFGYRTIREMLVYIERAQGVLPPEQALDMQVCQKLLPRLRGTDTPRLRRMLSDLLSLLLGVEQPSWGSASHVSAEHRASARLPQSAEKTRRMLERLDQDGFTDFYG